MAWETALDRLLLQQIHRAEKGEVKAETVRQQLLDLQELAGTRAATAFHLGYARTLLGLELTEPQSVDPAMRRWYLFGRLRGHDRRGERNWIADLLQDPQVLVDLLSDPQIAGLALPLVVRTLFWCGDLKLAVRAIDYLSANNSSAELDLIVDAALTDLLARLETRVDQETQESTASILTRVLGMDGFDRLPTDVRARYHRELARRLLAASDWTAAMQRVDEARALCEAQPRLCSSIEVLAALAQLREHDVDDVEPRAQRPERDAALAQLANVQEEPEHSVPEALFLRSLLAYEMGDYGVASRGMEMAIAGMRRLEGRDLPLLDRARFFQAAALLASGCQEEASRALQLMDKALESVRPDLESFYSVHEALKKLDRRLALRFLDAVDIGRGTSPDQLLFVALEYQSLGEADPAAVAARRVLEVTVNLDQRVEALRVVLTAHNMKGQREQAHACYGEMRDLLLQRGAFETLERLLKNEEFVGQALDHVEIKIELASLYEEMEGRDFERAQLQVQVARSLRARKETDSLRQAHGLLQEVGCVYPELVHEDLAALEKLLEVTDTEVPNLDVGARAVEAAAKALGHRPGVLVVGGNERQRRHHPRFDKLCEQWGFNGEWLMTNYTSPQKVVNAIADRLKGVDFLVLLHWNRHETTEPALELARKAGVAARTVHYAGFTSLQVALEELFGKHAQPEKTAVKAGR
jgi:tetratricopeptide (TPR) repeat protein